MNGTHRDDRREGRLRGERGSATVAALVLLFAFTSGAVIWLARDVNRRVSNQSAAQSIAFQAARTGAQQVAVESLRGGGTENVVVDPVRADVEARAVARRLLVEYELVGSVEEVAVARDEVTVRIRVLDTAGDVVGVGSARAESGP